MFDGPVLVVAAHPDDEVLGCGGTIARYSERVHVAILGGGLTSRGGSSYDADDLAEIERDSDKALRILGISDPPFERNRIYRPESGLEDQRFDAFPLLDVVKVIAALIWRLAPATILTHHPGDLNIDHQITFRAVLTAVRPPSPVKNLLAFEVPSSSEWSFGMFGGFQPNVFIDIGETIEAKVQAMKAYTSERRVAPHPRAPESLRALARVRGFQAGVEYAEAFQLIRSIP